ncbi:hypothetical protein ACPVPU_07220 [Sphingomonas sp. CJ99]
MSKLKKVELKLTEKLVEMLAECGVDRGTPADATGSFDRQGRCRRIAARWADGWRVTVNLHLSGGYSVSYSIRMVCRKAEL